MGRAKPLGRRLLQQIFEEEVKTLKGMIEAFRSGPLEYEICKENEGYASELGV